MTVTATVRPAPVRKFRKYGADIVRYVNTLPVGTIVWRDDVLRAVPDAKQLGVQSAMRRMVDQRRLRVLAPGRSWMVMEALPVAVTVAEAPARPAVESGTGRMFEQIGTTKSGAVLLRCEDGIVYAAREVDL